MFPAGCGYKTRFHLIIEIMFEAYEIMFEADEAPA